MNLRKLLLLIGMSVLVSLLVSACAAGPAGDAGDAPAAAEEAAPEAAAEPVDVEPTVVQAENCDYGGKIESIVATDDLTVQFNLCKPDPAFLAKVAFTPFGIQPAEYIAATGGTGAILEQPIGTGAYKVDSWDRGSQVTYKRFDDYWGEPAIAETAVLRWNQEGAARLLELQAGTVDMITNVSPDDFETVAEDPNLQLLPSANPNILYLGMTNTFEPFNNPLCAQGHRHGHRPPALGRQLLPGRLGSCFPLHTLLHSVRL